MKYHETDNITQLYLGDGAMSTGAFHEAANLSGLWGKDGMNPCLFIVENNQYGMGTSVERTTAMTDLAAKFDAYGIENEKVDGMDLEAVIEVAERTTEQVRESGKPYAVEALTYRTAPTVRRTSSRSTAPKKRSKSGASATRSGCWRRSSWREEH